MSKRRIWSDEKKRELVEETKVDGVSVASVARKHGASAGQLAKWMRDPRFGGEVPEPKFVEVEVDTLAVSRRIEPRIEITLVGGHRIVIEGVFDPASVVPLVHSFVA